jgi:hypothetical protein
MPVTEMPEEEEFEGFDEIDETNIEDQEEIPEPDYGPRREYTATDEEMESAGFTKDELKDKPGVQKRLNQMTWERNQARQAAADALRIAQENERKLEELQGSMSKWRDEQTDQEAKGKIADLERQRSAIKEKIRAAHKDGELEDAADLQIELSEVAAQLYFEQNKPRPEKKETAPPKAPETQRQDIAPEAAAWLANNGEWFDDPSKQRYRDYAISVEQRLLRQGYAPDDPDLYQELDRTLHKQFPGLFGKKQRQSSPPVSGVPRGESPPSKPRNRLTKDDLAKMRKYSFDPNNPEHRKAWLLKDKELS